MAATNPGTTNLISWWSMDETSGTRNDSHGSHDLTDNNSVGYSSSGKVSNAADFTPSDYLSIGTDESDFDFGSGNWTIGCWVKLDTDASRTIIAKTDSGYEFIIYFIGAPQSKFSLYLVGSGETSEILPGTTWSTGTWYFLTVWYDGSKAYLQVNNGTIYDTVHTNGVKEDGSKLWVGRWSSYYWDGLIDEMFVYKGKALSADEREWLYNSGDGKSYADLTAPATSIKDIIGLGIVAFPR